MTKDELKELKSDIRKTKTENIEAKIMMYKEYILLLIDTLIEKGLSSIYLEELNRIKVEYIAILSEENHLLNLILKNGINKNINAVDDLIGELNDSIDKTIIYYYNLLDDIEDEIKINRNYPYRRIPKNFETLIENDEFRFMVYGLNLTIKDVKKHLDYSDGFWDYVKDKTKIIKDPYVDYDLKMDYYGVWYDFNDNKELTKLIICIPEIVSLKTAQIAIHEFRHAHDIYTGNIKADYILEKNARQEEDKFKNNYLKRKIKHNILSFK